MDIGLDKTIIEFKSHRLFSIEKILNDLILEKEYEEKSNEKLRCPILKTRYILNVRRI